LNRNDGTKIAPEHLKTGTIYHFNSRALGRANLKFMGGSKFQVVAGFLQSQATKKKWNEGAELTLPLLDIGTFYELNDPGEVAE
jgi:hypothetical protein